MYKVLRSTKSAVRFSLKHSKKYLSENRYQESLIVLWFSFGGRSPIVTEVLSFRKSIYSQDYGQSREEEFLLITAACGELSNIGLCGSRIP